MKIVNSNIKGLFLIIFLTANLVFAQEQQQDQLFVKVKTMHWTMELDDFSMEEWKSVEQEYHEKVIMKNEYILSSTVLQHHFTGDSSEIMFIMVFSSWNNIDLAIERTNELVRAVWPDKTDREAFLKKQAKFYANHHSDEIYTTLAGAMQLETTDLPLMYYLRTSYLAFPDDGSDAEFQALLDEYNNEVTYNNEYYKAYYPQKHYYGSDRSEFIEIFCAETLASLEKGIAKQGELFRAHWTDDAAQEKYNGAFGKYLTGIHSDRIYSSVPELHKPIEESDN